MKGRDLVEFGQLHPDADVLIFHSNRIHEVADGAGLVDRYLGLPEPTLVLVVNEDQGEALYPHYFSTYCIDNDHCHCRLTCKNCEKPCLCPCHRIAAVK